MGKLEMKPSQGSSQGGSVRIDNGRALIDRAGLFLCQPHFAMISSASCLHKADCCWCITEYSLHRWPLCIVNYKILQENITRYCKVRNIHTVFTHSILFT